MDKLATYDLLLEAHPLWTKEAARIAFGKNFGKFTTGSPLGKKPVKMQNVKGILSGSTGRPVPFR